MGGTKSTRYIINNFSGILLDKLMKVDNPAW